MFTSTKQTAQRRSLARALRRSATAQTAQTRSQTSGYWNLLKPAVLIGSVVFFSVVLVLAEKPHLAFWPPIIATGLWFLLVAPLDITLPTAVFFATALNAPLLTPHEGKWKFFLDPLGKVLYKNLPIKLAPLDIILGIMLLRTIATIQLGNVGAAIDRRPPRAFAQAVMISGGAILLWTVYGIGTGGSFSNMLWQVRPLISLPMVALISSVAMARERCVRSMKFAILASGLLKVIDASSYYFLKVRPDHGAGNFKGDYVSTHADTTLWLVGFVILMADWFETRSVASRNRLLLLGTPLLFAMVINNRRTVWVMLGACGFFIVTQAHLPVKRQIARILSVTWPAIVLYSVAGVAAPPSILFKPIQMIKSVIVQDDASSSTRDIENYNLLRTISAKPVLGFGFGHPYIEEVIAFDVTGTGFKNYRYLPHNSFLGLWAFGGLFCAAGYHLMLPVAMYYAVWSRRRTKKPRRRAAGDWAACTVIAYLVQGWSDIGLQDWTNIMMCGVGLGLGASLFQHVEKEEEEAAFLVAGGANIENVSNEKSVSKGEFVLDFG
jgi:hypothetical protein